MADLNSPIFSQSKPLTRQDITPGDLNSIEYREMIDELIRLDVPILEVGSSSIGKSYSIREMMGVCGIRGEFLFVGTEKSEFIEGIPNLKSVTESASGEGKFTYLKPYWFPNKKEIGERLLRGRDQIKGLEKVLPELYKMWLKGTSEYSDQNEMTTTVADYSYVETLKFELTQIRRDEKDMEAAKQRGAKLSKYKYEDALFYISMIQGYGNFWLILDEIDKVEKQDKDKYAPLLHIVRERELKGWKLSGIRSYPEYDIKFIDDVTGRVNNLDKALDAFSKGLDVDLTDTRIIAIANDLQTMEKEAPALYRRFVKIVVDKSLYMPGQFEAVTKEQRDAKQQSASVVSAEQAYDFNRNSIHSCIVEKKVGPKQNKTIKELMADIRPDLTGKPLDEVNLQWTLGFLPEILFPGYPVDYKSPEAKPFIPNKFIKDFNDKKNTPQMFIYKIIYDNFEWYYVQLLMQCVENLVGKKKATDVSKEENTERRAQDIYTKGGITDPDKASVSGVELMLNSYQAYLDATENQFKESVEEQSSGKKSKSKKVTDVESGPIIVAKNTIMLGNLLIAKSLKDNKPTILTGMLFSAIPFMQNRFIGSSPYISNPVAKDLMDVIDTWIKDLAEQVAGKKMDTKESAEEITKNLFDNARADKDLVIKWGCRIEPDELKRIAAMTPADTDTANKNKNQVLDAIIARRPAIVYDPLLAKLNEEQKERYYSSVAGFKMIEKEIFENLNVIIEKLVDDFKSNQNKAKAGSPPANEFDYYCENFPNTTKEIAMSSQLFTDAKSQPLKDYVVGKCDEALAKGLGTDVDKVKK